MIKHIVPILMVSITTIALLAVGTIAISFVIDWVGAGP